jgi:hypothetical protein
MNKIIFGLCFIASVLGTTAYACSTYVIWCYNPQTGMTGPGTYVDAEYQGGHCKPCWQGSGTAANVSGSQACAQMGYPPYPDNQSPVNNVKPGGSHGWANC